MPVAEEVRKAEEARLAAEQAALESRPFFMAKGAYLGTGLTLWDFTHKDITTLG